MYVARVGKTHASHGFHQRSQENDYGYFCAIFLKFATNLDASKAIIGRYLNKTRNWRECCLSCKAERRRRYRQDAVLLTLTGGTPWHYRVGCNQTHATGSRTDAPSNPVGFWQRASSSLPSCSAWAVSAAGRKKTNNSSKTNSSR